MPKFDTSLAAEAARRAAFVKHASGGIFSVSERALLQPDYTAALSKMGLLVNEYKKFLINFGVDYANNTAFTEFMRSDELRVAVDKEFES